MGLSRNKVAVPEGAAGTPPFWRILKGVPDAARRKPSKSRNTSFLERTLSLVMLVILVMLELLEILGLQIPVLLYYGSLFIEKDEAERRKAKLEASPIAQLVRAPH